jgi:Myb/SANT-like DNA-binding domain
MLPRQWLHLLFQKSVRNERLEMSPARARKPSGKTTTTEYLLRLYSRNVKKDANQTQDSSLHHGRLAQMPSRGARLRTGAFPRLQIRATIIGTRYAVSTQEICSYQSIDDMTKLKKDFAAVKHLRERSGFGWDSTTSRVTATEDVWQKYLEVSHFL